MRRLWLLVVAWLSAAATFDPLISVDAGYTHLGLAYDDHDAQESLLSDYILWSSVVQSLNK